jgi:hypothetical protein
VSALERLHVSLERVRILARQIEAWRCPSASRVREHVARRSVPARHPSAVCESVSRSESASVSMSGSASASVTASCKVGEDEVQHAYAGNAGAASTWRR